MSPFMTRHLRPSLSTAVLVSAASWASSIYDCDVCPLASKQNGNRPTYAGIAAPDQGDPSLQFLRGFVMDGCADARAAGSWPFQVSGRWLRPVGLPRPQRVLPPAHWLPVPRRQAFDGQRKSHRPHVSAAASHRNHNGLRAGRPSREIAVRARLMTKDRQRPCSPTPG